MVDRNVVKCLGLDFVFIRIDVHNKRGQNI